MQSARLAIEAAGQAGPRRMASDRPAAPAAPAAPPASAQQRSQLRTRPRRVVVPFLLLTLTTLATIDGLLAASGRGGGGLLPGAHASQDVALQAPSGLYNPSLQLHK